MNKKTLQSIAALIVGIIIMAAATFIHVANSKMLIVFGGGLMGYGLINLVLSRSRSS